MSSEMIHYGPVWGKKRQNGESFAACDEAGKKRYATLTTHLQWVTCPKCIDFGIRAKSQKHHE